MIDVSTAGSVVVCIGTKRDCQSPKIFVTVTKSSFLRVHVHAFFNYFFHRLLCIDAILPRRFQYFLIIIFLQKTLSSDKKKEELKLRV